MSAKNVHIRSQRNIKETDWKKWEEKRTRNGKRQRWKRSKEENLFLKIEVQEVMCLFPPLIRFKTHVLHLTVMGLIPYAKDAVFLRLLNFLMQKKSGERKKKTTKNQFFYPTTLCILIRTYSGLNSCPSFHRHRSIPLRYRHLLLLSKLHF